MTVPEFGDDGEIPSNVTMDSSENNASNNSCTFACVFTVTATFLQSSCLATAGDKYNAHRLMEFTKYEMR
jgi:hypothetical protein